MGVCLEQEGESKAERMIGCHMELNPTQGFLEAQLGLVTKCI